MLSDQDLDRIEQINESGRRVTDMDIAALIAQDRDAAKVTTTPTQPTPEAPSVWVLWSDIDRRFVTEIGDFLFTWPNRESADAYAQFLEPGYKAIQLIAAGSELAIVRAMLERRYESRRAEFGRHPSTEQMAVLAEIEAIERIVTDLQSKGG